MANNLILIFLIFYAIFAAGQTEIQVTQYPNTVTTQKTKGLQQSNDWQQPNLNNLKVSDNNFVQLMPPPFCCDDLSFDLVASNFNFSLPSTANITQITVVWERLDNQVFAEGVVDDGVFLLYADTVISPNMKNTTNWGTFKENVSYIFDPAQLDPPLTIAQINSTQFMCSLRVLSPAIFSSDNPAVDSVRIIISYIDTNARHASGGLNSNTAPKNLPSTTIVPVTALIIGLASAFVILGVIAVIFVKRKTIMEKYQSSTIGKGSTKNNTYNDTSGLQTVAIQNLNPAQKSNSLKPQLTPLVPIPRSSGSVKLVGTVPSPATTPTAIPTSSSSTKLVGFFEQAQVTNANDALKPLPYTPLDIWEIDFNEIRLQTTIGKGSFGEVYKGIWNGQLVAVKILKANLGEQQLNEFRSEVRIMTKLHHANIVKFMGACSKEPNLCLVTELVVRGNLFDIIKRDRKSVV